MSGALVPTIQGLANVIDNTGQSWGDSAWWLQLQPGSWRGVGFVMDVAQVRAGRRVAIHEYPYRDTAWVEDLGKLPRRFGVQAYLIGDDVYAQRDAMVAACEAAGPGSLVHPTMGTQQVVLLDFQVEDRRERGRYVEVSLAFMLAGDIRFPATAIASGQAVIGAAGNLQAASAADLAGTIATYPTVPAAAMQVTGFTGAAVAAVNDATRALHAVNGLAGTFGRYAMGSRSTALPASATVPSLLSAACTSRTAVLAAGATVERLAGLI